MRTRDKVIIGLAVVVVGVGAYLLGARSGDDGDSLPINGETVITCDIDLDDHPTRAEVIEVLGEPVDVDHNEGSDDLDGSEWLPATDTLTWADGNIVTFDSDDDRASSWVVDHPRVC